MELLERKLRSDIDRILENKSKSFMFSAELIKSGETVGHLQLLSIDKVNMSTRIDKVLVGKE